MYLSRKISAQLQEGNNLFPAAGVFELPEKVLQFGTGVLLRGLPDHFIDKANKQGIFNGRIVVVKSTGNGGTDAFDKQDGLYTLLERGIVNGEQREQVSINASISRVLSARQQWKEILACAHNKNMQLILSNTTEVGITLLEDDAKNEQPVSFPGKLLVFLQERFRAFNGSKDSGMVIVPTELIVDNGDKLKKIVTTLAQLKGLPPEFLQWLANDNEFCNSLVDCIVPGKLPADEQTVLEKKLGYEDALMIMSEPYRLWAIETSSERTKNILSFSSVDTGIVLAHNIGKFRELKLRLLNATHTLSCGMAYFAGFTTVKEAMRDELFVSFITGLMQEEIIPLITKEDISIEEAHQFAQQVIDRFRNPYIEHLWLNITAQYTSKMAMRTVPLIQKHYAENHSVPEYMASGFAAFILFMRSKKEAEGRYVMDMDGKNIPINDDKAGLLYQHWQSGDLETVVENCLRDTGIFGADLTQFPGFAGEVCRQVRSLRESGAENTLRSILAKKTAA